MTENPFLRVLNFCMLLPSPEAQQLATYIGWRLNGTLGGIADGTLFVIPSIFVMLILSYLAVAHIDTPMVAVKMDVLDAFALVRYTSDNEHSEKGSRPTFLIIPS